MTNLQATRTRVVTWEDPTAAVQTGKTMSGIAYLREARSTDAEGKLYAHATTTCIILRPSSPSGRE